MGTTRRYWNAQVVDVTCSRPDRRPGAGHAHGPAGVLDAFVEGTDVVTLLLGGGGHAQPLGDDRRCLGQPFEEPDAMPAAVPVGDL
nr:hypothetical protein [Streptomyces olivoreticuli]